MWLDSFTGDCEIKKRWGKIGRAHVW